MLINHGSHCSVNLYYAPGIYAPTGHAVCSSLCAYNCVHSHSSGLWRKMQGFRNGQQTEKYHENRSSEEESVHYRRTESDLAGFPVLPLEKSVALYSSK